MTRLYWVVVRNDRAKEDTRMTTQPFPHHEAAAILRKLIPDRERPKHTRSLLVEADPE